MMKREGRVGRQRRSVDLIVPLFGRSQWFGGKAFCTGLGKGRKTAGSVLSPGSLKWNSVLKKGKDMTGVRGSKDYEQHCERLIP